MMKQQIIFFVGADMCGKTQIAKEVSRITGIPYFKASSEHSSYLSKQDLFLNQLRYADMRVFDLLRQTRQSIIFDRGYPCEKVYASVMGRKTDEDLLRLEDESYASLGAKIVICYRNSYKDIVDDLDPNINESVLNELTQKYIEFSRWTKCKTLLLNVDDENLRREVEDIVNFFNVSVIK